MVFEYQKETFDYLTEIVEKLEQVTNSRYYLEIGKIRSEYYHGNGNFSIIRGDLYLQLNCGNTFLIDGNEDKSGYPLEDEFDVVDGNAYVKFNEDLFLNLNEFISRIYKNKKEEKEFHRKLNLELCALIKAL